MKVEDGDTIKLKYVGTLEDGTIFESSEANELAEFEVGKGQLLKRVEAEIIGMEIGEEKEITLLPVDAFGERDDELFQTLPKQAIDTDFEPQLGMPVTIQDHENPDHGPVSAYISEISERTITLDFNHPLAGKKVKFKLKVVDILTNIH